MTTFYANLRRYSFLILPLAAALVGIFVTLWMTSIVKKYELAQLKVRSDQHAAELIDRTTLLFSNSILRIQSYEELFEFNRIQLDSRIPTLKLAISNTIFKRLNIYRLTAQAKKPEDLPTLIRTNTIEAKASKLPVLNDPHMQSRAMRQAIQKLLQYSGLNNQTVIHQVADVLILSVVWKATSPKSTYFVFSTPLVDLFDGSTLGPDEKIIVTDPFQGARWTIGPQAGAGTKLIFQQIADAPKMADAAGFNFPLNFQLESKNTLPGWPIYRLVFIFGLLLSLMASYLFSVLLSQNRRVSKIVIQKTRDLEQANGNLHEALMAKARFLANVSHEIRTPLNLILGMIELADERATDEKQRSYLGSIQTAGHHLLEMVEDIIDVAKPDTQTAEVITKKINLIQFLDEVAKIIAPICLENNLRFYLILASDLPQQIETDPVKLRQVLLNLLRNATKYTPKGFVSLRVNRAEASPAGKTALQFKVQDSGLGIPKDRLSQIFEAFFQIESAKLLAAGGVGLGLSIVKDVALQIGGKVSVSSTVGVGSTFRMDITCPSSDKAWIKSFAPEAAKIVFVISSDPQFFESVAFLGHFSGIDLRKLDPASVPAVTGATLIFDGQTCTPQQSEDLIAKMKPEKVITTDPRTVSTVQLLTLVGCKSKMRDRSPASMTKTSENSAPSSQLSEQPLNVLVADDDAGNRELFSAYLEKLPWTLSFADDGRQALEICLKSAPHVLVADLRMPGLDGFQLIESLRAFEREHDRPATKVVLVTADALEETADKARSFSHTTYLTKPVRKKDLIAAIQG